MIITRRSMLFGILAAPLIVRAGSLMAVKPIDLEAVYDPYHSEGWGINVPYAKINPDTGLIQYVGVMPRSQLMREIECSRRFLSQNRKMVSL